MTMIKKINIIIINIIDNINTPYSVGYINLLGFAVFVPVTMVMARIGAKVVYKIDKKLLRPSKTNVLRGDISKAKNMLGYHPKISFEEGMGRLIQKI